MPTNANSYGPYDAGAGANITENFWRLMARWFGQAAVAGKYLNELNPFGDSTGLQAKVDTGAALIRGAYGEWTSISIQGLAAVGSIAAGSERYDRLIVRNDFVNNLMQVDVLTGPVGVAPNASRPALTQTSSMYEMLLADVGPLNNATTTITPAMVIDGRWKATESGILYFEAAPSGVSVLNIPGAGVFPPTARELEVAWQLLTTSGVGPDFLNLRFNGDTAAHYGFAAYSGTGLAGAQTVMRVGTVPGTGGNPTTGKTRIQFPLVAATLKNVSSDTVRSDGVNAGLRGLFAGNWAPGSSTAVTILNFFLSAGNFSQAQFICTALP